MKKVVKFILASLFSLFYASMVYGQSFIYEIGLGYATTSTSDLIALQDEIILNSFDLNLKKTESFPSLPYINLAIKKKDDEGNNLGLFWSYYSTGGRLTVSDYSASVTSDQILNNHEFGVLTEIFVGTNDIYRPYVRFKLSALLSQLKLKDEVSVPEMEAFNESIKFAAQNVAAAPGLGILFNQFKYPIKAELSYLFQVTNFPFHLIEERDAKLELSNGNKVGPGLTGFRFGIGMQFTF